MISYHQTWNSINNHTSQWLHTDLIFVAFFPNFWPFFPNFCLILYVSDPMKISEVLTNSIFEAHSRTTLLRTEEIRQHWQKGVDQTKLFAFRNMVSTMAIRVVEFSSRGSKLERFLHKNQHTQRKLLNFELKNWFY